MKLSIIIPVYNEQSTIIKTIKKSISAHKFNIDYEIIIVDDFSSDNTKNTVNDLFCKSGKVKILAHKSNKGKGAAFRTGLKKATGDIVLIQDADLEYDPVE